MSDHGPEKRPDRTLGPGHDEFWAYCANGELRVQRCAACHELQWPVVKACEHCGSTDLPFIPLSGRGNVISWATFERDYYQGALPVPWDTILVELEEGLLFLSNPKGFSWPDITPDMLVRLAFLDAEDKAGPFRLPVFEKA
ncbi:MAG TPA: zinc ribbon domain-containing protein [Sphingobium sp.]|uniref:Zn-ribbon domain-containing OB-fold protein n=1 Tax=Sphingobium sp. TaxID=1912891 RepID=UPI002ED2E7CB